MQQQGSLIVSSVKRDIRIPKKDYDGNIYGWEFDTQETGDFDIKIKNISENGKKAIISACLPPHKRGIQQALEMLSQILPIGKSDVKQNTSIGYLVYDLFDEGISEYVVYEVCKYYRKRVPITESEKFFPQHGEFLGKAKSFQKKYNKILEELQKDDY